MVAQGGEDGKINIFQHFPTFSWWKTKGHIGQKGRKLTSKTKMKSVRITDFRGKETSNG